MRALIVDDERLARRELRRLLAAHPGVEIVGEAANVVEAREAIISHDPDLVFLDIEMPGGSGFDLLESLDAVPTIVFTTAFDEHALRAFEVSALDYLVKPIDPARLARAMERARRSADHARPPASGPTLSAGHRVFVRDGDRCWFIPLEEIVLIEADGGYARVHFEGEKPLISRSLAELEEKLDPEIFFRASRSQIINLNAVREIHPWFSGRLLVQLHGDLEATMSRRRAAAFQQRLGV